MNSFTKKSRLSSKTMHLIGLPSEVGGILIGLALSTTYHWVFFFIAPAITVSLFQYVYKYLYNVEIAKKFSVDKLFFCKIIVIQIVFIVFIVFILYVSIFLF